ncbi:hypothetical protein PFISCL1PPCAC_4676, partial [Pristionchus fissidentatus]
GENCIEGDERDWNANTEEKRSHAQPGIVVSNVQLFPTPVVFMRVAAVRIRRVLSIISERDGFGNSGPRIGKEVHQEVAGEREREEVSRL